MMTKKWAVLALGVTTSMALLATACGSSTSSSEAVPNGTTVSATKATPTASVNYGSQFLADAAPVNTALAAFKAAVTSWANANGTASQATVFVTPMVNAFKTFEAKLSTQTWPVSARNDVHSLVAAVSALSGDVSELPSLDPSSSSTWVAQLRRDEATQSAADSTVRSDLGLPPYSASAG